MWRTGFTRIDKRHAGFRGHNFPRFDDGELSGSVPAVRSPARITRNFVYAMPITQCRLMPGCAHEGDTALLLRVSQRRGNFFKHGKMLVDVRFGVLHRDGPLLVPPVGLGEHAAIYHRKPVVAPQIDINGGPVTVIANFLRVEHQDAIYAGADYVGLQTY